MKSIETYECDKCHKEIEIGTDSGPYSIAGEHVCQSCLELWNENQIFLMDQWLDRFSGKDREE